MWCVLGLVLATSCFPPDVSWLEPPSPGFSTIEQPPHQEASGNRAKTKATERGTDEAPFVVKAIAATKSEAEAAEDKDERQQKASSDWWLVKLTGGTVVGPNQDRTLGALIDEWVDDNRVSGIKEGTDGALCVWGTVDYEDVFGNPHFTNFCQILTWLPNGQVLGYYTPQHNDSD